MIPLLLFLVGAATIWPPEITDAPTFDRMDETDRSMRFMREVPGPACQGTRLKPVSVSVTERWTSTSVSPAA